MEGKIHVVTHLIEKWVADLTIEVLNPRFQMTNCYRLDLNDALCDIVCRPENLSDQYLQEMTTFSHGCICGIRATRDLWDGTTKLDNPPKEADFIFLHDVKAKSLLSGTDDQGNVWFQFDRETFDEEPTPVICNLCLDEITEGWSSSDAGENVCSKHIIYEGDPQ